MASPSVISYYSILHVFKNGLFESVENTEHSSVLSVVSCFASHFFM